MTDVISQPTTAPAVAPPVAPNFGLTKFLDPLRIPPVIRPHSWWHQDEITINMTTTRTRLHSQLPATAVWAYEGQFPGPTIEVRSGKRLRVAWSNDLDGTIPLVAVRAPIAQPTPGERARLPRTRTAACPPGVELIDGVADLPRVDGGAPARRADERRQRRLGAQRHAAGARAAHRVPEPPAVDHALVPRPRDGRDAGSTSTPAWPGCTSIRDDEEDALDLPGGDHEIPLIITDRNLDTDPATGALTGQLLFKVAVRAGQRRDDPVHRPVQPGQRRHLAAHGRRRPLVPLPGAQRGELAVLPAEPDRRGRRGAQRRGAHHRHGRRPAAGAGRAAGRRPGPRPGRAGGPAGGLQPVQGPAAAADQHERTGGRPGRAGPHGVPGGEPGPPGLVRAAGEAVGVLRAAAPRHDRAGRA